MKLKFVFNTVRFAVSVCVFFKMHYWPRNNCQFDFSFISLHHGKKNEKNVTQNVDNLTLPKFYIFHNFGNLLLKNEINNMRH